MNRRQPVGFTHAGPGRKPLLVAFSLLVLLGGGLGTAASRLSASVASVQASAQQLLPVTITQTPLSNPETCIGNFLTHTLDHITTTLETPIRLFESNGAGVAVGDLDNNGYLDIVFANLNGPASIFWNEGNWHLRKQNLPEEHTRAVNIVDVDSDGLLDIVFTHGESGITIWHNLGKDPATGEVTFKLTTPQGIYKPAYSMAWGDLSGSGALDVVTASYDAELNKTLGNSFLFGGGAGVYLYHHQGDTFVAQRLAGESQGLAIALLDVNGDGRRDILVGNDFDQHDQTWLWQQGGWQPANPFRYTTDSTMSLDWGDVDNTGRFALFATDMKPYAIDVQTMADWLPMMATMHRPPIGDPQLMENVFQVQVRNGVFENQALSRNVDATGWSWSGKFGDLDNDGFLDLYVVNGMIAKELFGYLPNNQLVEQNQVLHNDGHSYFLRSPAWGLGSTASGRGMTLADLNNDGRLDVVVNNLLSPAQVFENQLCGGSSLEVELNWSGSHNTRVLGAIAQLHTSAGTYTRDVRSGSGFLSGDAPRMHFGFPADAKLESLEIHWPDGQRSHVDTVAAHNLVQITR